MSGQMMSKFIGRARWLKNRSELKLHLSHRKMEHTHAFSYVQYHIHFVYQDTLLSELHNS